MKSRFYPAEWPEVKTEATPDKFEIVHFDSFGEGIKTKVSFKKGDIVFSFAGIVLPYQNLFTLQYRHNLFIYDPYVMGKVLHSCNPNMSCSMYVREFIAKRDIEPGELLTMDYEETEDELSRAFECHCGSTNCRKYISGRHTKHT